MDLSLSLSVKFSHLRKPFVHGPHFVYGEVVMLKVETLTISCHKVGITLWPGVEGGDWMLDIIEYSTGLDLIG